MDSETIFNALNQIKTSIDQHKDEIERLDQEIGDGDHIFNIQRGIKESLNLKDELSEQSPSEVLKKNWDEDYDNRRRIIRGTICYFINWNGKKI